MKRAANGPKMDPMPKPQMTGVQFREWREGQGLTMTEAAKLLSGRLERTYRYNRIHEWENGKVPVPALVAFFILSEREKARDGEDDRDGGDAKGGSK